MVAAKNSAGERLADEEQINGWSMHTTSAGRQGYDRPSVEKDLRLMRAAESSQYTPVETVQVFPQHRGQHRNVVAGTITADNTSGAAGGGSDKTDTNSAPDHGPAHGNCAVCGDAIGAATGGNLCRQCEDASIAPHAADTAVQQVVVAPAVATLDLQAELEKDDAVGDTFDQLTQPPDWEGAPTQAADVPELLLEAGVEAMHRPKRKASVVPDATPVKTQKVWSFSSWGFAPSTAVKPPDDSRRDMEHMKKRMCVLCGQRSKNYGPPGGSKQWCGPCAKLRGGTLHCR